jgi:hypothetical protein
MNSLKEQAKIIKELLAEINWGKFDGEDEDEGGRYYFNEEFIKFLRNFKLQKEIKEQIIEETSRYGGGYTIKDKIEIQETGKIDY